MNAEVIIIGSGASAVHLAQTLVESHRKVLMLDVGITNVSNMNLSEGETEQFSSFTELRMVNQNQYKYILGERLESIKWGPIGAGAQLTPNRQYMIEAVNELIPKVSSAFSPYESLARGGLGVSWGAGCYEFSAAEISRCGLEVGDLQKAYKVISDRIGISKPGADIKNFTASTFSPGERQIQITKLFQNILNSYERNHKILSKNNFYLGTSSLALLSKDRVERKAHSYRELEFYDDKDRSIYRPWMSLQQLRLKSNFTYRQNILVTQFIESQDCIEVIGVDTITREKLNFKAKILSLAAGTLGTARIVLRSMPKQCKLPLLCNSYSYYPALRWSDVGKEMEVRSLALAQLMMFHQNLENMADIATASLYSYKSLMLFRLMRESPFHFEFSRKLFQFLQSGLVVFGIHHPDEGSNLNKELKLEKNNNTLTGDQLVIDFYRDKYVIQKQQDREKKFIWAMKKLGCYPITRVDPGPGSSIHYGGSLRISEKPMDYCLGRSRKLHNTKRVFVADGSGLNFLPAKGLTLTLMALGHVTGMQIIKELDSSAL